MENEISNIGFDDLRKKRANVKKSRKKNILFIFSFIKKNYKKIIIFLFFLSFLIFPKFFGMLLGKWMNLFFGSIIKNII